MKKNILLSFAAIAALMVSCTPKDDTPTVKGSITAETVEYTIPTEGTEEAALEVQFTSNVEWKAAFESEIEWATIKPKSGAAGDAVVKVTADAFDEPNSSRTAVLVITGGDAEPLKVTLTQNGEFEPYFSVDNTDLTVGVSGGTVSFTIDTNVEFETTTYEQFEAWAPFTLDGTTGTFTVATYNEYDARQAYVKFTIPSIQVPVLDEDGNDTGTTEATVVRVYVSQDGHIETAWETAFDESLPADTDEISYSYTTAIAGDYLVVSTSEGVYAYNKATGDKVGKLDLPVVPQGITNDDAGNIVFFTGGVYLGENLQVYYLPADKLTDASAAKLLLTCAQNGFMEYYALDNIRVSGDVTKDASITMLCAAGWDQGSYLLFWEVKNGEVALDNDRGDNKWADYVGLPFTAAMWNSRYGVAMLAGTTVNSGVFYNGYDGNYNLHYNPGTAQVNWQEVFATGSSWAEGYNAMDLIEWNGHKYLSMLGMAYFPHWGMPSYLFLLNVDDPTAPVQVSKHEIYGEAVVSSTTDLVLDIEGGKLVAYVVDAATAKICKVVYPAL